MRATAGGWGRHPGSKRWCTVSAHAKSVTISTHIKPWLSAAATPHNPQTIWLNLENKWRVSSYSNTRQNRRWIIETNVPKLLLWFPSSICLFPVPLRDWGVLVLFQSDWNPGKALTVEQNWFWVGCLKRPYLLLTSFLKYWIPSINLFVVSWWNTHVQNQTMYRLSRWIGMHL